MKDHRIDVGPIDRLSILRASWDAADRPGQGSVSWNRASWERHLPDHRGLLDQLPARLDRTVVGQHFGATMSEDGAMGAFVVAMIWGHGSSGYGAWRTARILELNSDSAARLASAGAIVRRSPIDGYVSMGYRKSNSLRYLGPAFGTKFLSFAASSDRPAPILDALVARWIRSMSRNEIELSTTNWRPTDYRQYLELLERWSDAVGLGVSDIERLIFADSSGNLAGERRSQWAESWVPAL